MTVGSPLSTAHLPRPDPERGIFETLLVVDARPVELDAHLDRLAASARELFGPPAMARVVGPARALAMARASASAVADAALTRLRLTLSLDERGALDLTVASADVDPRTVFPPAERGVALAPIAVDGGLGRHKWADRRLLEGAADAVDGQVPLVVDGDVLEAERANVFALRGDTLVTPPDDGRILPGIARERTIGVARELGIEVHELPIRLDDLCRADEIFLTGSVRGVEPVGSVAGQSTPSVRADGPIATRLAAALRARWLPVGPS